MTKRHTTSNGRTPITRHDFTLAIIPTALLASALTATLLGVPPRTTMTTGGLIAAAALVDALFINPPRGPTKPDTDTG